jgi:hypothetical protein
VIPSEGVIEVEGAVDMTGWTQDGS